jgi:hypothetical protein
MRGCVVGKQCWTVLGSGEIAENQLTHDCSPNNGDFFETHEILQSKVGAHF